eukprot:TRINITY_DN16239_c0_g2_i5.p1 TRINITY_DN16239_c0_g2~~TRINITY_DN16239_c0_g2_i5.p1  ORF type:complete len:357 (-),score=9.65 TRINITY_DN16239_c0_g2_i5:591-1661(-)
MDEVAFETLCMMSIGQFMGYFMWGLSGFGAGLTVVCVWSFFKSIGFNAGPIQLIIGADSISNIVASIPFLIMTESYKYGDYGIFGPIVIIRNISNFFGAYIFHSLNENVLQLIIGPVLLFLALVKYVPITWKACCGNENQQKRAIEVEMQQLVNGEVNKSQVSKEIPQEEKNCQDGQNVFSQISGCCWLHIQVLRKLILLRYTISKLDNINQKYTQFKINDENVEILYSNLWIKSLPVFLLSASFSGVMGSMVGIPGPPMMYAFQYLQLSKNVVRANASVANVLNFRAIFYFVFGSIQIKYWYVYLISTSCAIIGLITGNILSQSLTTQSYHHVLMFLVTLAGILLILQGAGIMQT